MSLTVNNLAIDDLIQSSSSDHKLRWIPASQITDIKFSQIDTIHYATYKKFIYIEFILLLVGSDETCTPTFVSGFARTYSLPTHKYNNDVN